LIAGVAEAVLMAVVAGVYQLRIRLRKPVTADVGALGRSRFSAGWYVYTGSARSGLRQRIDRHLRREKRKHWHIDYLLSVADGAEAFVLPSLGVSECDLHQRLCGGEVPIVGFGSSDCRCRSHLAYFKRRPKLDLMPWREFEAGGKRSAEG